MRRQVASKPPSNESAVFDVGCNARFAGRRKAGGGYNYFDLCMQPICEIGVLIRSGAEQTDRTASIWFLDAQRRRLSRLHWQKDGNEMQADSNARVNLHAPMVMTRIIQLPQPQTAGRSI